MKSLHLHLLSITIALMSGCGETATAPQTPGVASQDQNARSSGNDSILFDEDKTRQELTTDSGTDRGTKEVTLSHKNVTVDSTELASEEEQSESPSSTDEEDTEEPSNTPESIPVAEEPSTPEEPIPGLPSGTLLDSYPYGAKRPTMRGYNECMAHPRMAECDSGQSIFIQGYLTNGRNRCECQ